MGWGIQRGKGQPRPKRKPAATQWHMDRPAGFVTINYRGGIYSVSDSPLRFDIRRTQRSRIVFLVGEKEPVSVFQHRPWYSKRRGFRRRNPKAEDESARIGRLCDQSKEKHPAVRAGHG